MFLSPPKVVEKFNLWPGMKVADFGCGSGHFSSEIAKRIGRGGIVYAFDVQKEVLEALEGRLKAEELLNVETSRVDLETENATGLKDALVDLVLVINILFQVERKEAVAKEAFRILKPGGEVVVIDWDCPPAEATSSWGPLEAQRMKKEEAEEIFKAAGFEKKIEIDVGDSHYGLIFVKPAA
jgi:ubiquinone/menaquinone biosynthesis C-methylase UbiE